MPEFLSFMVSNRSDWEEAKRLLDATTPGRFPGQEQCKSICTESRKLTDPCYASGYPSGFFGGLRQLLDLEDLAYALYDDPDLVEDVLEMLFDLWVRLYIEALKNVSIDFFGPWEDLCYKSAPMLSPKPFRRYLRPRYQRLTEALRSAGMDIFFVDIDGDPRHLIDSWEEGGVTGLYPWETQMGLDNTRLRRDHPELHLMGGIDKHQRALGRRAIDRELEKIPSMLESSRYLPCLDHSVPTDVSWDDYRYFCKRLRDLSEHHPPHPSD